MTYITQTLKSTIILGAFIFITHTLQAQNYAESAEEETPALISTIIPDVTVKDMDDNDLSLREMVSNKPTVIVFYRGGWCPYCNLHLADLKKIEKEITSLGYQIIAISADRPELLKATVIKNNLGYNLFSDSPMSATMAFGLAFKVDTETVTKYKSVGIDLEADSGYKHHLLPAPAVYLVNTKGEIKFNYVNPNYKDRIDGGILLAAAKAFAD